MRAILVLALVGAAGCSPSADDGVLPHQDVPRTDADAGGPLCDATDCVARCAAAGYPSGECIASGACVCVDSGGRPGSAGERCDDGIDNNANGAADEGCGCDPGTSQACYTGNPTTRNRGACRDGNQPCIGDGEFSHWGACSGDILPAAEVCDGIDNDCDLAVDEGCGACEPTEMGGETICNDGLDNDCDGSVDCVDADCPPCCTEEICDDGRDNNCDTVVDERCDDPCLAVEMGPLVCNDGLDNDCDGRTDCRDLQCLPFCCTPEQCGNLEDDDCDGRTDCSDTDCCTYAGCAALNPACTSICCVPGAFRWCDTPTYCSWGRQTCRPDGRWGACEETAERPPGCDDGSYYYSAACCVAAGACCQNFGAYDPGLPTDASVGRCDGVSGACPS